MRIDILLPWRAELGEGINLFPDGEMRWVDLPRGTCYIWDGKKNRKFSEFGMEVSKVLPWKNGSLALAQTAIIFLNDSGIEVDRIELHDTASHLRCSDGLVLPNGELLLGILDRDLAPHRGRLIRVHQDRTIETIVDKTTISNGITLLADGKRIAWADSPKKEIEIFEFDLARNTLSSPVSYARLPDDAGLIDGMCADSDGGIWAALWRGSGVAHFDASGRLDEIYTFAAPNVTSCGFDRENNLLLTTGTATLTEADLQRFPGAGSLWQIPAAEHGTSGTAIHVSTL